MRKKKRGERWIKREKGCIREDGWGWGGEAQGRYRGYRERKKSRGQILAVSIGRERLGMGKSLTFFYSVGMRV